MDIERQGSLVSVTPTSEEEREVIKNALSGVLVRAAQANPDPEIEQGTRSVRAHLARVLGHISYKLFQSGDFLVEAQAICLANTLSQYSDFTLEDIAQGTQEMEPWDRAMNGACALDIAAQINGTLGRV